MAGGADAGRGSEAVPPEGGQPEVPAEGQSSIHVIWETPRPVQTEPVVSVNVLCLAGAIVGAASLFLPWYVMVEGPNEFGASPASMVLESYRVLADPLLISALVFITGTVVAFLFPAGFAVQAAGIILFFRAFSDYSARFPSGCYCELSLGFYAGVLSSMMVLAGLLHPVGPGYDLRWPWWSRRTEVSSRADFLDGRLVKQGLAMPGEVARSLKGNGPRAYVAVVVISLTTGAFLIGLQMHQSLDPVITTDYGVRVIVGDAAIFVVWDYASLTLTDGSATVNWTAESVRWEDGHRTKGCEMPMAYFGERNLSGLVLGLSVVDVTGDRRVTTGDMMFLMPSGGSSFAEDVSYRMVITYPRAHWYYQIIEGNGYSVPAGTITFEFQDGEVASSSADSYTWYYEDSGHPWALVSVAIVAGGSAILGAAYYFPVRAIRRRVLAGQSRRGRPPKPPEQEADGGRSRPAHESHGFWGRFLG